ncbi:MULTISPECIES: hypothetical protein [unclassified Streptomyces]|uniref:hypothetical protein n=1 Tax=unclassified Streptomyces TaxID=2593676 RepID=UPI00056C2559|nr:MULTISPECIES: hypothetical protein [unclassified Streptomyces]MYT31782.1 hypothetical protein [Streptomyces sp. SID8354]
MGRHTLRASPLPDPDVVFRPTRRDVDPATGEPATSSLWDRHQWQPQGECWLWCGRDDIEVTWIGPVRSSGMHAALYACRACLYQLDQRVLDANMRKDASALPANRAARFPKAGRHRRAAS